MIELIHPNCSELITAIKFKDEDDIRNILKKILEETHSNLVVDDLVTIYSKTPLNKDYPYEDLKINFDIEPDEIVLKRFGDYYLGVNRRIPDHLSGIAKKCLLTIYITRKRSSVWIDVDGNYLKFSISDGDENSFKLIADIARIVNHPVIPYDGGDDAYFKSWCKKHGYEALVEE